MTVIIPSYRRPDSLRACLVALEKQTQPASQVVVVMREGDEETAEVAAEFPGITVVTVTEPGVIHAMSEGLRASTGDIVALTDDDAAPDPDWIEKLNKHFEDPSITGVGGRDILPWDSDPQAQVGIVSWSGKAIGNHHCGSGAVREVDVLKGVNCAFRRDAIVGIGFDKRLLGSGAQVHWEAALCLALRRKGAKLIYDPELTVHHNPAPRTAGDNRTVFDEQSYFDRAFNGYLVMWEHLRPLGRTAFWIRNSLLGNGQHLGLALYLPAVIKFGHKEAGQRLRAARKAAKQARMVAATRSH